MVDHEDVTEQRIPNKSAENHIDVMQDPTSNDVNSNDVFIDNDVADTIILHGISDDKDAARPSRVVVESCRSVCSGSRSTLAFLCYAIGIFVSYLLYGVVQEVITRGDYNGEKFVFAQALVFVQCFFNVLFAKGIINFVTKAENDSTTKTLYASCAFCYMGAMVASNQALMYISYPTQVLGKACKPIPVMILGVLLARKRYPLAKYFCILMIVIGVAMFMYKDAKNSSQSVTGFGFGEILLLTSLTLDGLTGVTQEKMRSEYHTNQHQMMYHVNLWSCFILAAGLIVTGQGIQFVQFVVRHPKVIWYLLMFSATSAVGQHFIFLTVVTFGPLTCSVITTTRKFFTILFSVLLFQNPMNGRQWVSTFLVFTGLTLDSFYGRQVKETGKLKVEN